MASATLRSGFGKRSFENNFTKSSSPTAVDGQLAPLSAAQTSSSVSCSSAVSSMIRCGDPWLRSSFAVSLSPMSSLSDGEVFEFSDCLLSSAFVGEEHLTGSTVEACWSFKPTEVLGARW
ncbi:hypothetical protein MTO96_017398 [Rhipicephalus appendiculatus]